MSAIVSIFAYGADTKEVATGRGPARAQGVGNNGGMISADLARALHDSGIIWSPMSGDRFIVSTPGMEEDVFYLADMTVEVHRFSTGNVIGFNGVTEWALDSVDLEDTLWLPREDQIRVILGPAFVRLEHDGENYVVVTAGSGSRTAAGEALESGDDAGAGGDAPVESRFSHPDAECAYARALLDQLEASAE